MRRVILPKRLSQREARDEVSALGDGAVRGDAAWLVTLGPGVSGHLRGSRACPGERALCAPLLSWSCHYYLALTWFWVGSVSLSSRAPWIWTSCLCGTECAG